MTTKAADLAAALAAGAVLALAAGWCGSPRPRFRHGSELAGSTAAGGLGGGCPEWFAAAVRRAALGDDPAKWWRIAVAAVLLAATAGALAAGPTGAVALAAVAGGVAGGALHSMRHRLDDRLARTVPEALEAVARAVRGGSSVPQALGALDSADPAHAGRLLKNVALRVERGDSLRTALDDELGRHRMAPLRLAAAALSVVSRTGAGAARALDGVAMTLRERAALEREVVVYSTQARASAAVMVLVPIGFGLFTVLGDPRVGDFLLGSAPGLACLAVGVLLDAAGAWWMTSMVRAAR